MWSSHYLQQEHCAWKVKENLAMITSAAVQQNLLGEEGKVVSRPILPFQNAHSKPPKVRGNGLLCSFSILDKENINAKCSEFYSLG